MSQARWNRWKTLSTRFLALLGAILLAAAFPPYNVHWTLWVGLAPLLGVISIESTTRTRVAAIAFLAGTVFCLMILLPLISADQWQGWAQRTAGELADARARQRLTLILLLVGHAVLGGVFWGLWAWLTRALARGRVAGWFVLAPATWVVVAEWLRAKASWGFHWAFLGNATADVATVRQLASLGGDYLLSWYVVLANLAVLAAIRGRRDRRWRPALLVAGAVLAAGLFFGWVRVSRYERIIAAAPVAGAAAVQHHKDHYTSLDYLSFGLDGRYFEIVKESQKRLGDKLQLIVLPETINSGVVSLDGTRVSGMPDEIQVPVERWVLPVSGVLDPGRVLALGSETVYGGRLYNSMLFFTYEGLVGVYHKQRLVPFAEYTPPVVAGLGPRGRMQYQAGDSSSPVEVSDQWLGAFICQEVLFPEVVRRATRSGATLLVSGGNDGVFTDPSVAEVHASVARLRAVESGRFIVRAMKTGVSQIIDPTGREVARSLSADPVLLWAPVRRLTGMTPAVRLGPWPVWLASLICVAWAAATRFTRR